MLEPYCRIVFTLLAVASIERCAAQNLLPNGDFEKHTGCPSNPNELYMADEWIDPSYWTPDYFHMCGFLGYGVPVNAGGFQIPHSDSAYAGIFLFSVSPVREYIETPLLTPLAAGETYYFEMFMNLADNSKYSARNIGVYFSDTLVNSSGITLMPFTPQIANTGTAYPDTANWYPVSGYYTAHGGESYLIIGNFDDDANTPLLLVNPAGFGYAVVYIDDVSLTMSTDVESMEATQLLVQVHPVPFADELTVTVPDNGISNFQLFELSGRIVRQERFSGSVRLRTDNLPVGSYTYAIRLSDGSMERGHVVKE